MSGLSRLEVKMLGAGLLDVMLCFLFMVAMGQPIDHQIKAMHIGSYSLPIFFFLVLSLEAVPMAILGGTPGLTILGLKFMDQSGERPNLFQAYRLCFMLNLYLLINHGRRVEIPKGWQVVSRS